MEKYIIAPPAGSQTNAIGAKDRPWEEVHAKRYPGLNEYLAESTGYGIVSGCEPSINGLTVTVSAGVIHTADGRRVEVPEQSITLDAADATKPRTDVVYLDKYGKIAKLTGELGTPAVAGSNTYTISTNFAAGDTVTFGGMVFTCTTSTQDATNFAVGADTVASATNLAATLNANYTFKGLYNASVSSSTIVITEKAAGSGNTPGTMTTTGNGSVTIGSVIISKAIQTTVPSIEKNDILLIERIVVSSSKSVTSDVRKILAQYHHKNFANILDYGTFGDGVHDDTSAIQAALNCARTVYIPSGYTFGITRYLEVFSNTEIIIDGVLKAIAGSPCFELFSRNEGHAGYTGVHDVYIHGNGTFDANANKFKNVATPFRVHHCNRVRISNITIKNYGRFHAIEIGGSQYVKIERVKFFGAIPYESDGKNGSTLTAVQIEHTSETGTSSAIPYDGAISHDITLDGCIFDKSDEGGVMWTAFGSHSWFNDASMRPEHTYKNIVIKNCIFKNFTCFRTLSENDPRGSIIGLDSNYENVIIEGNRFLDGMSCDANKAVNCISVGLYSKNIRIKNNDFQNISGCCIYVRGGDYVLISDNYFRNCIVHNSIYNNKIIPGVWSDKPITQHIIKNNFVELTGDYQNTFFHKPYSEINSNPNSSIIFENNSLIGTEKLSSDNLKDLYDQIQRFRTNISPELLASGEYYIDSISLSKSYMIYDFIFIEYGNEKILYHTIVLPTKIYNLNSDIMLTGTNLIDDGSKNDIQLYEIHMTPIDQYTFKINHNVKNINGMTSSYSKDTDNDTYMKVMRIYGYRKTNIL